MIAHVAPQGRTQEQTAAADATTGSDAPTPLTADEFEALVARIAFDPDESWRVVLE